MRHSTLRFAPMLLGLLLVGVAAGPGLARDIPEFQAQTMDRETFKFADIIGKKIIVIDFWATYCIQCRPQLDALQKLQKKYKDEGLEVIIVSVDSPQNESKIKPYFKTRRYTFPVILDTDSQISRALKPTRGLPYTLLVDMDGNIVYKHEGYKKGDERHLEKLIKECIEKGTSSEDVPAEDASSSS